MKRIVAFALAGLLSWPLAASACNACLEDKIAATYDAQVVAAARQIGHVVVFAAIQGKVTPGDEALARSVRRRLNGLHGVDPQTVRVSLAPPAVSFACNAKRHPPAELVAAANQILRGERLSLQVVRVGAPGSAAP